MSKLTIDFTGRKCLVTGAAQGIGRHIALALAANGASVVALDRHEQCDKLKALVDESKNIQLVCCDITSSIDVIRNALAPFQPFHHLVNNAAIAILEPFLNFTIDTFDRTMAVNVRAPAVISQILATEMIAHSIHDASIVHISSQSSTRPLMHHTTYCTSKAGVDMLAKMMAMELGEYGIRVNCVNPTVVLTDLSRKYWTDPTKCDPMFSRMALKRFAAMDEVSNAVLMLLAPCSSMTTGATLPVDGGYTLL